MVAFAKLFTLAALTLGASAHVSRMAAQKRSSSSLAQILSHVSYNLNPPVQELTDIAGVTGTVQDITKTLQPIIQEIVTILDNAVVEIQALTGARMDHILATVDGKADADSKVVAVQLSNIFNTVLIAVGKILGATSGGDLTGLVGALLPIVKALLSLLQAVLNIVAGVLVDLPSILLGLLADVLPVLSKFGVGSLLSILGL